MKKDVKVYSINLSSESKKFQTMYEVMAMNANLELPGKKDLEEEEEGEEGEEETERKIKYRTKELCKYPQHVVFEIEFLKTCTDVEVIFMFEKGYVSSMMEVEIFNRNKKHYQQKLISPKSGKDIVFNMRFGLKFRKYFVRFSFEKPLKDEEVDPELKMSFSNIYDQVGIESICFHLRNSIKDKQFDATDIQEDYQMLELFSQERKKVSRKEVEDEIDEKYRSQMVDKAVIIKLFPLVKKKLELIKEEKFEEVHDIQKKLKKVVDIGKKIHTLKLTKKTCLQRAEYLEVHSIQEEIELNYQLLIRVINDQDESDLIVPRKKHSQQSVIQNHELKIQSLMNKMEHDLEKEEAYFPKILREREVNAQKFFKKISRNGFGE